MQKYFKPEVPFLHTIKKFLILLFDSNLLGKVLIPRSRVTFSLLTNCSFVRIKMSSYVKKPNFQFSYQELRLELQLFCLKVVTLISFNWLQDEVYASKELSLMYMLGPEPIQENLKEKKKRKKPEWLTANFCLKYEQIYFTNNKWLTF